MVAIRAFLANPDEALLERNLAVARSHFNVATLAPRLAALLEEFGMPSNN
jgi:hypothetical protein